MAERRTRLSSRSSSSRTRIGAAGTSCGPVARGGAGLGVSSLIGYAVGCFPVLADSLRPWWAASLRRLCAEMQALRFVLWGIGTAVAASHQTSNRFRKLRQFIEDTHRPQPLFVVECRRAALRYAGGYVPVSAALGGYNDPIADIAVSGDPHLPGEYDVLAYYGRACEPNLRAKQCMVADRRAVPDLRQVVDFDAAANTGFTDAGAIDASVRLHLDIALQHGGAGLRDFLPMVSVAGKSKTVTADHCAVLQNDIVAQCAVFAHHRMCVGEEVVADPGATVNDHMRQQHGVVANLDIVVDHHVCADVSIRSQLRGWRNYRGGMYTCAILRGLIEQINRAGEGKIRVLAAQHSGGDGGEVLGNNYR